MNFGVFNDDLFLYRDFHGNLEIFDSIGEKNIAIWKKFVPFQERALYNSTRLQGDTENCGAFLIYYGYQRYLNPFECYSELLNCIFSSKLDKNEEIVKDFMNSI